MEQEQKCEEMWKLVGRLPVERQRELLELARAAKTVEASLNAADPPGGEE